MKKRKGWLALSLWLCTVTVTQAGLLDEVIREPGMWNQMCAMPRPLEFDVPLPMYGLAAPRNLFLSTANRDRLRAQRAVVVADIVKLLNRMDLSKATNGVRVVAMPINGDTNQMTLMGVVVKPSSFTESNQDPEQLTGTLLDIILQLDVVEALPGLSRVEAALNERLGAAAKDGGASLPELDLDSPVTFSGRRLNNDTERLRMREFPARVYQREILSVMAALLRHERYQPLLNSDLEAKYFEHLKQAAGGQQLASIHSAEDIPSSMESWIGFDPVHRMPFHKGQYDTGFVPYTPELRLEIRKWAADYLQQKFETGKTAASTAVK
jgi:hypothetical protein